MGLVLFIVVIINSGPGDLKFMSCQQIEERGTDEECVGDDVQKTQPVFWRRGDPHQPLNERIMHWYVDANARIEPSLRLPGTLVSWQGLPNGDAKGSLTQGPLRIECSFTKGESSRCWMDYSSTPDVTRAKTVLGGMVITEIPGPWWVAIGEMIESFQGGVYAEWEQQDRQYWMDQLEQERRDRQEHVWAEERRLLDAIGPHIDALRDLNAQNGDE